MPCNKNFKLYGKEDIHKLDEEAYQLGEDEAKRKHFKKRLSNLMGLRGF